jgi:hypothetical protein
MEVQFAPDLQPKLSRMAAAQGRATEALMQQAGGLRHSYRGILPTDARRALLTDSS